MVTGLSRIEPQTLAAYWKTFRACWPTVVPGLPPTGAAGVGSLKPTPGALTLTMTMLAAPKTGPVSSRASAKRPRSLVVFMVLLLLEHGSVVENGVGIRGAVHADLADRAVRLDLRHGDVEEGVGEVDRHRAVRRPHDLD